MTFDIDMYTFLKRLQIGPFLSRKLTDVAENKRRVNSVKGRMTWSATWIVKCARCNMS